MPAFKNLDQVASVTPTAWPDAVKAFPGGSYTLSIQYKLADGKADEAALDALVLHDLNLGCSSKNYPYLVSGLREGTTILSANSGVTYNEGRAEGYQVGSVFVLQLDDHSLLSEFGGGAFKFDAAAFGKDAGGLMEKFGVTDVHAVAWLNGAYLPSNASKRDDTVASNMAFEKANKQGGVTKLFPTGCVTHQVHCKIVEDKKATDIPGICTHTLDLPDTVPERHVLFASAGKVIPVVLGRLEDDLAFDSLTQETDLGALVVCRNKESFDPGYFKSEVNMEFRDKFFPSIASIHCLDWVCGFQDEKKNFARKLTLEEATAARERIFDKANKRAVLRTPLVKLNYEFPDGREIYLKLENLQAIGSFKIRGAMNAILSKELSKLQANGVVTASAGNMGQGVAYGARQLNFQCKVVVPDNAPQNKCEAMERLGAQIVKVPYAEWWEVLMDPAVLVSKHGIHSEFIHPVCDAAVMAGHASIALETIEDLGDDLDAVLIAYGGGGLTCGIASAVRDTCPSTKVYTVEPETACPVFQAFANDREIDPKSAERWKPSFVDGCGGKTVLAPMWPLVSALVDDALQAKIPDVEKAIKIMAERNRFIAEGAGAVALAAAMDPNDERFKGKKKIVCIVCGGALDSTKLCDILTNVKGEVVVAGSTSEAAAAGA